MTSGMINSHAWPGQGVRPIPLHGVNEIDAEQRADAHDDGEALVDGDGFREFQREGIVFPVFEAEKLEDGHQQRTADR